MSSATPIRFPLSIDQSGNLLSGVPDILADSTSDNSEVSTETGHSLSRITGSHGVLNYPSQEKIEKSQIFHGVLNDISSPNAGKIEKYHCNDDSNIDSNNGKSPNGYGEQPRQTPFANVTYLFNLWYQTLGSRSYTAAEVIELAKKIPELTSVLLEIAYKRRDWDVVCPMRLGRWLPKQNGWTDGILRLSCSRETNRKIALWSVRKVAP